MDTSVSTPQAVATVLSVEGQAFARDPAGQMRPLKPGDVLREGDTIVTMPDAQVQLAFLDGHILTLLPNETFQFSAETSSTTRPEVAEAGAVRVLRQNGVHRRRQRRRHLNCCPMHCSIISDKK